MAYRAYPAAPVEPGKGQLLPPGAVSYRRMRPSTPSLTLARLPKAGQLPGRRVGFPRYKRRKHEQGFRADNGPDTVRVEGQVVILPRIGPVPMVEQLRFAGFHPGGDREPDSGGMVRLLLYRGRAGPAADEGGNLPSALTWAWEPCPSAPIGLHCGESQGAGHQPEGAAASG